MGYIIDQLVWWLLATAFAAGVAGWAFHRMRTAEAADALDKQREQARKELIGLVLPREGEASEFLDHERESDLLRTRGEIAGGRIAELERQLEEARAAKDAALARVADLERSAERAEDDAAELERLRALAAEAEDRRAAELEVEATPVPDASAQRWRMRYLDRRVNYLESISKAAEETAAQLAAAQARILALEAARPAPSLAAPQFTSDWTVRYLEARLRHLENAAPAPDAGDEEEAAARRAWRMRYLETRLGHIEVLAEEASDDWANARTALEERVAALEADLAASAQHIQQVQPALEMHQRRVQELEAALAARDARIRDLEANAPAAERAKRLAWRARYLDARVRHLEESAARGAASATPAASPPLAPAESEESGASPLKGVRPPGLPAARDGAPDDLTLIDGVSPLQQSTLHALGVFHFDQIAAWTPDNVAWVDRYLRLRGRIGDEAWVEQARARARGEGHGANLYRAPEEA